MIPLGDVPILIDSGRIALPHYGRKLAHAARRARRVTPGPDAGLRILPTFYRRSTDAIQTPRTSLRRPR